MGSNLGTLDDGFGNWLAGFIDGEGCFFIARQNTAGYLCGFALKVRDDDAAIIHEIHDRLGIGKIYRRHGGQADRNGRPQIEWKVLRRSECFTLLRLLERAGEHRHVREPRGRREALHRRARQPLPRPAIHVRGESPS